MRRILITGGAGFIGTNFIHYWTKQYPEDVLVILDTSPILDNTESFLDMPKDRVICIKGNIRDHAAVLKLLQKYKLHTILHFAAETNIEDSITNASNVLEANVMGTQSVLQAAVDYQKETHTYVRFHHISTGEVYGSLSHDALGFSEDAPYAPNTPYAASKAASDQIVCAYGHSYGLPVTISHSVDIFGPHQNLNKLIPKVIHQIINNKEILLYGNGYQTRSWIYVQDYCQAIDLILHQGSIGEKYNIGSNVELSNVDLIRKVCQVTEHILASDPIFAQKYTKAPATHAQDNEQLIRFTHDSKGHDMRYALNPHKIALELGFKPQHDFDQALTDTIYWYLNQWLTKE